MSNVYASRVDVPEKDKWKLEDIFESDALWEETFKKVKNGLPALMAYQGKLHTSSETLLSFIEKMHDLEEDIGKLYAYAHMRNDEDKAVAEYQELYDRCRSLLVSFNENISFFEPELLAIPEDELKNYIHENGRLQKYEHYLENIVRVKPHVLSPAEERIIAMTGEIQTAAAEIFGVWDSADIQFPTIKDEEGKEIRLTNALYGRYQQHPDRRLRKDAYMGLYVPFIQNRNTLAISYSSIVKSHLFTSRVRSYPSTVAAALDANAVPVDVYFTLINSATENLAPLHRYNRLRKKVLALTDGVHDYDLRAPLFEQEAKSYSWDEAVRLCIDGLQPMGNDYLSVLKEGFSSGWIDVYENKGKRTGAYSSGTYGVHPYVLMNYNGTLNDIFTLAHEMGHALHTWYTINNQPFVYGDYPIFLAEVASTANELLLQDYLINSAGDKNEKLAYLNAYLDKFSQTFFRQVLFAEFEWESHRLVEEGQALTADKLDSLFGDIYRKYHGDAFVLDRETRALWSRVPHFYYNYYVFQYATSFVASSALVRNILDQGEKARDRFLTFLKSGRSKYPIETLRESGVDLSTAEPTRLALKWMDALLDQVEELI